MHRARTCLFAALLVAASVSPAFGQGAPPAAPPSGAKAAPPPAAPPSAAARPAPPPPPSRDIATEVDTAMSEKSQALFKEGNNHFRDAKYAQAQAAYKAAWALDLRNQKVVRNLGLTELELHQYRDAAEHLTIALRLADATDPKRDKIQAEVAEARAKVGALLIKLAVDGVEIVHMDSGRAYTTPLVDPIFVDPGKVGFRIRREGYESQEKVFDLKPGEEVTSEVTLVRPPGYGQAAGPSAPTSTESPAPAPRSLLPAIIGGGAGVLALAIGGALVGVAVSSAGDIDAKLPRDTNDNSLCRRTPQPGEDPICPDLRGSAQSASTLGNVGVGLLAGGGVLVAAAAAYWLIPTLTSGSSPSTSKASAKTASRPASSRLVPAVSAQGGGLVWTGSF